MELTVESRTVLHSARKFRLERWTGHRPDGRRWEHEVIVHPGAAVVLPILPDGRVLLIANQRPTVRGELLELPAGTLEDGESPRACAARELVEETGWQAGRLEPLVEFYSSPGICTERMHVFLASELVPGAPAREADEVIRTVPMDWEEVHRALAAGRIQDGKTLVGLLYYDSRRRRGQ